MFFLFGGLKDEEKEKQCVVVIWMCRCANSVAMVSLLIVQKHCHVCCSYTFENVVIHQSKFQCATLLARKIHRVYLRLRW